MFTVSKLCILCLTYKNLKTILSEDNEGIVIQKKLKFCLPEIVDSHLDIPEYICINCMSKLNCFYKFKQWCLQNNTHLKNCLKTLTFTGETYKHLSIRLTDIKNQDKIQAESKDQTLPTIGSDDELQTGRKEKNGTCSEETEVVIKTEIQCDDVLDNKESHPLYDIVKDTIVKEEYLTSEDNCEIECYDKFVKRIKCEASPSDSDVSISNNPDEVSKCDDELQPLFDEAKETIVKEEYLTSEDMGNFESYDKFVKTIKYETNSNDSDVPVSNNEDLKYANNEYNSIELEENIDEVKDTIVKEEFFTTEGNGNFESYDKFVKIIKCETNSNDSDVSVSNNEDLKYSYNSNEYNSIELGENNKFQCAICSKEYTRKHALKLHLKLHADKKESHAEIKNYECSTCKKKFMYKTYLVAHEMIHSGIKKFKCLICNKMFRRKPHLTSHENMHKESKNYECTICKKRFAYGPSLYTHYKTHSEERKFECKVCKKKFKHKTGLNRHEKLHSGVKNFKCLTCNKMFMLECYLKSHEKSHKDE